MAESIQNIRRRYEAASEEMLPSFIEAWESDPRAGVRAIVAGARKRLSAIAAEHERIRELRDFERETAGDYLTGGYLCGIDEAGRGPLAGPVAAGAVILPPEEEICGINDSKKLTPAKREKLYEEITSKAISWAVGLVSPARIDEINILQATYEAMRRAEKELRPQPEVLIVDAVRIPGLHLPQVRGRGAHTGASSAAGAGDQGRCKMSVGRGGQYPCKGDQGPHHGGVRQAVSGIWICGE